MTVNGREEPPLCGRFFACLRLIGIHPIVWHQGEFRVSATGFLIVLNFLGIAGVAASWTRYFLLPMLQDENGEDDANPIHRGVQAFVSLTSLSEDVLIMLLVVTFNFQRERFARVFNNLNDFWSRYVSISLSY